jgi:hypothetical protein
MDRVTGNSNCQQPPRPPDAYTIIRRLERRLERLERLLDEGIGAYLSARFPYGDGKTDRWGRRR